MDTTPYRLYHVSASNPSQPLAFDMISHETEHFYVRPSGARFSKSDAHRRFFTDLIAALGYRAARCEARAVEFARMAERSKADALAARADASLTLEQWEAQTRQRHHTAYNL